MADAGISSLISCSIHASVTASMLLRSKRWAAMSPTSSTSSWLIILAWTSKERQHKLPARHRVLQERPEDREHHVQRRRRQQMVLVRQVEQTMLVESKTKEALKEQLFSLSWSAVSGEIP